MLKVSVCANHRCPIRFKCGKVFEPQELQGMIEYKHYHFTRDQGGRVQCHDFVPEMKHGK
jgi:hypothetical protein